MNSEEIKLMLELFKRRKKTIIRIIGFYVGIIGFISAFFELVVNYKITTIQFVVLSLALLAILATIEHFINENINITDEDLLLFNLEEAEIVTVLFPCKIRHVKIANKIANQSFSKANRIGLSEIQNWWEINPYALTILLNIQNNPIGYFDIYPIKDEFEKKFAQGIYSEKDLIHGILPYKKNNLYRNLYIAGIAVLKPNTYEGRKHAALLLRSIFMYLNLAYGNQTSIKLSATAATEQGRQILEKLGFKIENGGEFRKDGIDYYFKNINKETILNVLREYGSLESFINIRPYKRIFN